MTKLIYISLFTFMILSCPACYKVPPLSNIQSEKIKVGPGPEDMVLDTLNGNIRLILSCCSRRESHPPYGEIIAYHPETDHQVELVRYNEPGTLLFKPHGIYLDRDMLYVISHEREPDYHPILVYQLHGDSLEFKELIHTTHQHSPNALVTGPDGEIYFVNDSGKRGSMAEKIFKLRRASIVRLMKDAEGQWKSEFMAMGLGYPAGINRIGHQLYVGDAILNKIQRFNISMDGLTAVNEYKGLRGCDNIRIHNGRIITTGHVKPFKFIKHTRDPEKISPVEVSMVDPTSGKLTTLYFTDGTQISAGSTALIWEEYLYISQVFDPFILKVHLSK